MVCHTADPSRTAWRIGIEHPLDPLTLIAVLPIRSGRWRPPVPRTVARISSTPEPVENPRVSPPPP